MKKAIWISCIIMACCAVAQAALPTLSSLADAIEELRFGFASRLAETSNRLAEANAQIGSLWAELAAARARLDATEATDERVATLFEGDQRLREAWHGGKLGTYIVTNGTRTVTTHLPGGGTTTRTVPTIIRVDLYADATAWTNGVSSPVRLPLDPEQAAKEIARRAKERERIQAAWEAANLPPDLAALRAAQREAARQESGE